MWVLKTTQSSLTTYVTAPSLASILWNHINVMHHLPWLNTQYPIGYHALLGPGSFVVQSLSSFRVLH